MELFILYRLLFQ